MRHSKGSKEKEATKRGRTNKKKDSKEYEDDARAMAAGVAEGGEDMVGGDAGVEGKE